MAKPNPWYRERWPWILMAGPGAVIVAGVVTVYLAVTTNDGLVVSDYYKRGLAVNQELARDTNARARGLVAEVGVDHDAVQVRMTALKLVPEGELRLNITHPTRAGHDQIVRLAPSGEGRWAARIDPLTEGRWLLVLEDLQQKEWRLSGSLHLPDTPKVSLQPETPEAAR